MKARFSISLIAALASLWLGAQTDPFTEALRSYRAGELDKAREQIDLAVRSSEHAEDAEAWLVRGYIYKDLFKEHGGAPMGDELRDEAVGSLYTCLGLEPEDSFRENALQAYDYLARTYYNDAARALSELNDQRAISMFAKHKETILRVDPDAKLTSREVEFLNALGTVYNKLFNQDRTRLDLFDKAVVVYEQVLGLEPGNYGANYNLATLYYNRGVLRIRSITADDDIPSIQQIQEVARDLFQQALPFMLKAHELNPSRRETLIGLEGIYYSLQDQENAERFRQLFEELPPQEQDR